MQHRGQQDHDRLAEIYLGPQLRVAEDAVGVAQVALDGADSGVSAQQGSRMGDHDRIVVGVDDAGLRSQFTRDLAGISHGGQPGPDVDDLPDAHLGDGEPEGAGQEVPVRPCCCLRVGHHGEQVLGEAPVVFVIVLAARMLP
jgi:hypothetical protein